MRVCRVRCVMSMCIYTLFTLLSKKWLCFVISISISSHFCCWYACIRYGIRIKSLFSSYFYPTSIDFRYVGMCRCRFRLRQCWLGMLGSVLADKIHANDKLANMLLKMNTTNKNLNNTYSNGLKLCVKMFSIFSQRISCLTQVCVREVHQRHE